MCFHKKTTLQTLQTSELITAELRWIATDVETDPFEKTQNSNFGCNKIFYAKR